MDENGLFETVIDMSAFGFCQSSTRLRAMESAHTSLFNDSNVAVKLNAGKIHARLFTVGYALSHSA